MSQKIKFLLLSLIAMFFTGCIKGPEPYNYSSLLQSKPRSILVLMPRNQSTEPAGSSAVLANVTLPLAEAGYYVFPAALVNDTFRHNGFHEAAEIHKIPLHKLKQIFGADAVLYLNVTEYGTTYLLIDSVTKVAVHAKLVDLNNGAILWERSAVATNQSNSSGNIFVMLISAVIKQIGDSITDAGFNVSALADNILFMPDCHDCLLRGEYSPNFRHDKQLSK